MKKLQSTFFSIFILSSFLFIYNCGSSSSGSSDDEPIKDDGIQEFRFIDNKTGSYLYILGNDDNRKLYIDKPNEIIRTGIGVGTPDKKDDAYFFGDSEDGLYCKLNSILQELKCSDTSKGYQLFTKSVKNQTPSREELEKQRENDYFRFETAKKYTQIKGYGPDYIRYPDGSYLIYYVQSDGTDDVDENGAPCTKINNLYCDKYIIYYKEFYLEPTTTP